MLHASREPADLQGSSVLDALAARLDAHCLLEADGVIYGHAVAAGVTVPEPVIQAIVTRQLRPLVDRRRSLRTLGVFAGSPVIAGGPPGWTAVSAKVPVVGSLGESRWLWLITTSWEPSYEDVVQAATELAQGCSSAPDFSAYEAVEATLTRDVPLPPRLRAESGHFRVLTVTGSGQPEQVYHGLVRTSAPQLPPCRLGERVHVVLPDAVDVLGSAHSIVCQAEQLLGFALSGVLSDQVPADSPLVAARRQAERAAEIHFSPGSCVLASSLRSQCVLAEVDETIAALDGFGPDPVVLLDTVQSGVDLAGTLLAWLDAHGDVPRAARVVGLHPNTLRYRLRRAFDVLQTGLDDPDERLELHLRLRTRRRPRPAPSGDLHLERNTL